MRQSRHIGQVSYYLDTDALEAYAASVGLRKSNMLEAVGTEVRDVAVTIVREDTSLLKESLTVTKVSSDEVWVHDGPGVNGRLYGIYQEFGPLSGPGWGFTPFMRPAFDRVCKLDGLVAHGKVAFGIR